MPAIGRRQLKADGATGRRREHARDENEATREREETTTTTSMASARGLVVSGAGREERRAGCIGNVGLDVDCVGSMCAVPPRKTGGGVER